MFRTMGKLQSDRRGFTLTELLVVCAIMAMVAVMIFSLGSTVKKGYNLVEKRYILQNEVKYVMNAFEYKTNVDAISTAFEAAIFYEPDMEGIEDGDTGTFNALEELGEYTFDDAARTVTFQNSSAKYTYIFCMNGFMYVLNYGQTVATRYYLTDDTRIELYFEINKSANPLEPVSEGSGVYHEGADRAETRYLSDGLRVVITGREENVIQGYAPSVYTLDTSFAFRNFENGTSMNYVNGAPASTYIAGWTSDTINTATDKNERGYPANVSTSTFPYLHHGANVLRYYSETAYFASKGDANSPGFNNVTYRCSLKSSIEGSKYFIPVVNSMRDFRDNTLKGTAFGDWFIDEYYNTISPAIIAIENKIPQSKEFFKAMFIAAATVINTVR
ncbi:MAG: prepilin-type N-terminal cleavage/methylation domain-containing protein [Ruminococcaceae bacterium]|nr:prepilin-type N-terminal cleavage/methylation domain-containing protein [Oscillospiraceae bacterium]